MEFIGRKRELQELEERYQSGRFEMGVIYGARRIGKTSLLKKFSEDKPSLYFQARNLANSIIAPPFLSRLIAC